MRYFIVHAHHEPKSFNGALTRAATDALRAKGHDVDVSDLCAMGFDPVSDRRNFTTTADASYLKQQREEMHATEHDGFAPDIEAELAKLDACDVLVFQFPLWWFGMPAILKGWCDRVLAMGRVYGGGRWYEHGVGAGKRAVVSMTTGGPPPMYDGTGLNPAMARLFEPIHHGVFWFNGFQPVEPFITWGPSRMTDTQRKDQLSDWADYIANIEHAAELPHLPEAEFDPEHGYRDRKPRFMVTWTVLDGVDLPEHQIDVERDHIEYLRREGTVLSEYWVSKDHRRGGLIVRAHSKDEVNALLQRFPLATKQRFEVDELEAT